MDLGARGCKKKRGMFNITEFERKHGLRFVESENGFRYYGNLFLYKCDIESLPNNLVVEGYLDLEGTCITSLPDNLTVGSFLDIRGTKITSLPDNLTVGDYLDIRGTKITSLPDNLIVGGLLNIEGTRITHIPNDLVVGGSLDLRGTDITSLPDDLTVGGVLDIRYTGITSLPNNLTVGGILLSHKKQVTSIPDNLTVNKDFVSEEIGLFIDNKKNNVIPNCIEWHNGKYIKADGIFSEVVSHKGNVRRIKKIGSDKIAYLVTDGRGKWAHGETLEEAKRDLIYKISKVDKSKYENYTLDTEVTFEEGIEMYRVITGACSFGVKDFAENRLKKRKEKYKVSEIISITKGEYGNKKLCDYFNNKKNK